MMMINQESKYALQIVLYISHQSKEKVVSAKEISDMERISLNAVLKISRSLAKNGILESSRGSKGGFKINKEKINFFEIIKVIQGDPFLLEKKDNEIDNFLYKIQKEMKTKLENKLI